MTLVQCIFRNCLTIEDENETRHQPLVLEDYPDPALLQNLGISRAVGNMSVNDIPPSLQLSDDSDGTSRDEASGSDSSTSAIERTQHGFLLMIQNIFKHMQDGFNSDGGGQCDQDLQGFDKSDVNSHSKESRSIISPLLTATVYKSMNDIPSIALEQVVLPGSPLQHQMSIRMKNKGILSESTEDECVICMEPFHDSNPRIPTKCGCGDNMTYFHLPCLYQWAEQCVQCPTCREELIWKEL